MATIKDIAELANVSRGTVDKVIHNRPGVNPETRNKVQQIISQLNYKPNPIGMALANSRTVTRIGIVLTPAYNQFMQITINGIQHAAKNLKPYGVEVITRMPAAVDPAEELNILRGFHEDGINNIALFPLDDPYIINYANQLLMGGTSLITFNSRIQEIKSLWFIGQDHVKGGRTAAQLMMKLLPQGGKIGAIISSEYMTCHQDRLNGFEKKLSESPLPYQILDVKPNEDMTEAAFRITLEWLRDCPDLSAIYITGGGVNGVASALKYSGKAGQIKLVCHDLLPDSEQLLREGIIDFVIDQNPFEQGELIVTTLFDYQSSRKIPSQETCSIPIHVRVSESL